MRLRTIVRARAESDVSSSKSVPVLDEEPGKAFGVRAVVRVRVPSDDLEDGVPLARSVRVVFS